MGNTGEILGKYGGNTEEITEEEKHMGKALIEQPRATPALSER